MLATDAALATAVLATDVALDTDTVLATAVPVTRVLALGVATEAHTADLLVEDVVLEDSDTGLTVVASAPTVLLVDSAVADSAMAVSAMADSAMADSAMAENGEQYITNQSLVQHQLIDSASRRG